LKGIRQSVAETLASAGRVYGANGNSRRAEDLWSRAAVVDPANITCRLELAAHYLATNRLPEALDKYGELAALEPRNPVHHLNAGLIHARLKRYDAAESSFRKALELKPDSSWACRDLAQLYLTAGKNLPEARRLASKAVELEPTAQNHFILSWACDKSGDLPAALAAIQKALDLEPQNQRYVRVYEDLRSRK
jgi:tetratricopeptide (TPR) repeat protein